MTSADQAISINFSVVEQNDSLCPVAEDVVLYSTCAGITCVIQQQALHKFLAEVGSAFTKLSRYACASCSANDVTGGPPRLGPAQMIFCKACMMHDITRHLMLFLRDK